MYLRPQDFYTPEDWLLVVANNRYTRRFGRIE